MRNDTEWVYIPLNEERVVARQIKELSKQDASYQAKQQPGIGMESGGGFALKEAIQCTYIDLDQQISDCKLSDVQRQLLIWQMYGYSLQDAAAGQSMSPDRAEREFRNAVASIVRQNLQQWRDVHARKAEDDRK